MPVAACPANQQEDHAMKRIDRGVLAPMAIAALCAQGAWAEPLRVMSLGDSITAGFATHNYRAQLAAKARTAACDIEFVGAFQDTLPSVVSSHSAIWGVQAATVDAAHIDAWMAGARPDVVLMLLGINDIQGGGRQPGDVIQSLRNIVGKMRAHNPSVRVFLGRYPDVRPELPDVATLNRMIPVLATELDTGASRVTYVDHSADGYDVAIGADTVDALHPNENGDARYANNWFRAMVQQGLCDANTELVNAALHKPAAALAGPYGYGTPFNAVNDTVNDLGWTRTVAGGQDQVLELDLQGIYNLRYLELSHFNAAPEYNTRNYRIEASSDRQRWQDVASVADNRKARTTHKIAPVDARYLRLTVQPPFFGNTLAVRELRAMGLAVARP